MREIDLEPHEYGLRGRPRFSILSNPVFTASGILCGIWAGSVIGYCRYMVDGEPLWMVVAVSLFPGALWGLIVLALDRGD